MSTSPSVHDRHACSEYNSLSRRTFMQFTGGAGLLAAMSAPAWLPRVAYAADFSSSRDILLVIFLRGGADGLTLCAPVGDPSYYGLRPTIAVPEPGAGSGSVDLDSFFALPPALAPLQNAYLARHLAIVHATGSVDPTRSHFDAMRYMELGKAQDPALFTGWLGRHLLSTPPMRADAITRAIAVGEAVPTSLSGGPMTSPVPNLAYYGLDGRYSSRAERLGAIMEMYAKAETLLKTAAENTQRTIDLLAAIDFAGYTPGGGAAYPETSLGYTMKSAAALIRAGAGVEVVSTDVGGWDTHSLQGTVEGQMANLMSDVGQSLAAFHTDIIANSTQRVVVVCMSEFGRRAAENGSLGCDHGHGNAMFVMGQAIRGGRVLTEWPGLADLYEDLDLKVTIDYRDILAEILHNRCANRSIAEVFPDFKAKFRGITGKAPQAIRPR